MLQIWEEARNAIDSGLAVEKENKELIQLQNLLGEKVRKARLHRQQRDQARAERTNRNKEVWRYSKEEKIALGRLPMVTTVKDDEDEGDGDAVEHRWHHHYPHTGQLPRTRSEDGVWAWPVLFVYPSHRQSDFIEQFGKDELIAIQMAQMFPKDESYAGNGETDIAWDFNNEFRCSNLVVYFEVHCMDVDGDDSEKQVIHPDSVEQLTDLGSAMRFYESSQALQ
eukprot:CCRYP_005106-RA/>CCRYP_005106-RA protein AED:0.01 eAED:0.01 QI:902/1/1/1/1/1/2/0/223